MVLPTFYRFGLPGRENNLENPTRVSLHHRGTFCGVTICVFAWLDIDSSIWNYYMLMT
jgi:hypothetical protein